MTTAVQRITLHPGAQDDDAIAAVVACLRSGGLAVEGSEA